MLKSRDEHLVLSINMYRQIRYGTRYPLFQVLGTYFSRNSGSVFSVSIPYRNKLFVTSNGIIPILH
ncbi:hypothetical protein HanRHA438_Chr12g0574551 [Helianthus annuus]|nr:hypothetical protein HanRHA438_Chr12g0574551 [Helianthus annuus]